MTVERWSTVRGKRENTVEINDVRCRSCGICYDLCPEGVLAPTDSLRKATVINMDSCTGCRLCEWQCTDWAITVRVQEVS